MNSKISEGDAASCRALRRLRRCAGSTYIEYFVLAAAVAVATIAFYGGGSFGGSKGILESTFDRVVNQMLAGGGGGTGTGGGDGGGGGGGGGAEMRR